MNEEMNEIRTKGGGMGKVEVERKMGEERDANETRRTG